MQLRGVFAHACGDEVIVAPARLGEIDTISDIFPAAAQDEREAHDAYGVRFAGHRPLRPLLEHPEEPEAWMVDLDGQSAHRVAVGPIHAGVIESGHFRFTAVGERILHLDLRLFYKHRGLQRAAEGHPLADGLRYAQRACAACAACNSVAYAQACESALGLAPDEQMRRARTLLLELERLYNHLNDLSAICAGVGFAPGAMALAGCKERAQRLNLDLAGHRFLFGAVAVASSSLSIERRRAEAAANRLRELQQEQLAICRELRFAGSLQARLDGVGAVTRHDAARLGAVGPVARACGLRHDTRSESPLLSYEGFAPAIIARASGDVAARMEIREVELEQTFALLDELLAAEIAPGAASPDAAPGGEMGVARVESPRGETTCAVQTDGRKVRRLHLRTGSYANWPVLAEACREALLPDFPLINKSFELCYACVDR